MGTGLAVFYGHKIRELSAFLGYRILSSLLSLELFMCRVAIQSLFVRPLYNFLQKKSYAVHYFRVDTCIYKGFRRSILILLIYSRFYT